MSYRTLLKKYNKFFYSIKDGNAISVELEVLISAEAWSTPSVTYEEEMDGPYITLFTNTLRDKISAELIKNKMYNVDLSQDSSIYPEDEYINGAVGVEFKITGSKDNIRQIVDTVKKLQQLFDFTTNVSCGLHIHTDTRLYTSAGKAALACYFGSCINYLLSYVDDNRKVFSDYYDCGTIQYEAARVSFNDRSWIHISDNHDTIEFRMFAGSDYTKLGMILKSIIGMEKKHVKTNIKVKSSVKPVLKLMEDR